MNFSSKTSKILLKFNKKMLINNPSQSSSGAWGTVNYDTLDK
jgi:hypothetical protein